MIWNEAFYPGKLDCWMNYPYEREGLFSYLQQAEITGVLLIGGDIHRSRHLVHPTRDAERAAEETDQAERMHERFHDERWIEDGIGPGSGSAEGAIRSCRRTRSMRTATRASTS